MASTTLHSKTDAMECIVTTNMGGVPYLVTTNVNVSTTSVDLALGFRRLQPIGLFAVRIAEPIPAGTTATLPVTLSLNGVTRQLTQFGGEVVTAGDITGSGVFLVFNDRFNGILQLVSTTI